VYLWLLTPRVGPYCFPALNKGNPTRTPRGFLIGSAWVKPTSLSWVRLLAPGRDAVDQVGPGHYSTPALDTLLDIADLPVGGLDWSDMAQEAGSHPCPTAPKARKPLLLMDLPNTGREGSKFWKLNMESIMNRNTCQSGAKNKSLQKLPPSLPVLVGGFCTIRGS
jgi:hypothetical protein